MVIAFENIIQILFGVISAEKIVIDYTLRPLDDRIGDLWILKSKLCVNLIRK